MGTLNIEDECAQFGIENLAKMLGVSRRTLFTRRKEYGGLSLWYMMRQEKVTIRILKGKRRQPTCMFFPSAVQRFLVLLLEEKSEYWQKFL